MGRKQNKNICLSYLSAFLTILGQALRRSYKKNECTDLKFSTQTPIDRPYLKTIFFFLKKWPLGLLVSKNCWVTWILRISPRLPCFNYSYTKCPKVVIEVIKNGKNLFVYFSFFPDELNWFDTLKMYQSRFNVSMNVCSKKIWLFWLFIENQKGIFLYFHYFNVNFESLRTLFIEIQKFRFRSFEY